MGVMAGLLFDTMAESVGFSAADARRLKAMGPVLAPRLCEVVDEFYGALGADRDARVLLEAEPDRVARLRETLHQWLVELFEGAYGQAYHDRRGRIGRAHVRAGLPQHFMITGMSIVRQGLTRLIREAGADDSETLDALNRLLDLELGLMLETYREDLATKIRKAERDRMQARLDEAHHMASIGQLAAALAHEIKNPLAGISGAIQVILQSTPPDHPHREVLHEVIGQVDRLDAAVKDALIYSRPKPPRRKRHNVGEVVQRVLNFLREEPAVRDVQVDCEGLTDQVVASLDEAQFQQVISNLLLNAAHASERGGRIRFVVAEAGDKVCLDVIDQGHGMPHDVLVHAFDPFYTTKAKGTGLGLPICRHIVDAHGGAIAINSRQGEGTVVHVELPRNDPAARGGGRAERTR